MLIGCPHRILFIHGPGRIGKTTLVRFLRHLALDAGRSVVHVDGRESDVDTDTLRCANGDAGSQGVVVLVDGYEQIAGLDTWIRETWLPALPADAVVVLAGREPPTMPWQADPGWRSLVSVHELGLLGHHDAAELLGRAGVDHDRIDHLVGLGPSHVEPARRSGRR